MGYIMPLCDSYASQKSVVSLGYVTQSRDYGIVCVSKVKQERVCCVAQ